MAKQYPVITIDGPSGSGKGTIARLLAKKLTWHFLDSGVIYRVLALAIQKHGIAINDLFELTQAAVHLQVEFILDPQTQTSRVFYEAEDVTDCIRGEECGNLASQVAAIAAVRTALLERQRTFLRAPGLVADGRDMGTVVFPEAPLKFYLNASEAERAQRRFLQLKAAGINVSLEHILQDIKQRDQRDMQRAVAPLMPAKDAIMLDTTGLSIEAVLQKVYEHVAARLKEPLSQ